MKRILLIDDDPDIQLMLGVLFDEYGIELIHTESSAAALTLLAHDRTFDAILVDLVFKRDIDGYQLLSGIRKTGYNGVCVAISSYYYADTKISAKEHGFRDFFPKPLALRSLVADLDALVSTSS